MVDGYPHSGENTDLYYVRKDVPTHLLIIAHDERMMNTGINPKTNKFSTNDDMYFNHPGARLRN